MSFQKIIIVKGNKYLLEPSKRENKKYDVYLVFNNKEMGVGVLKDNQFVKRYITSFGDKRYEDYTQHKNDRRKELYKSRHKNDFIYDPNYAGFWSYWMLWNKKSINESIKDIEKRFN